MYYNIHSLRKFSRFASRLHLRRYNALARVGVLHRVLFLTFAAISLACVRVLYRVSSQVIDYNENAFSKIPLWGGVPTQANLTGAGWLDTRRHGVVDLIIGAMRTARPTALRRKYSHGVV